MKKTGKKNKLFTLFLTALLTIASFPSVLADEEDNPIVEVTEHGIEITKSCAEAIEAKLDMSEIEGSTAVLLENDSITVTLSEVVPNDEFKQIEYVTGAEVFYSEQKEWYFAIVHFDPSLDLREKAALVAEDDRVLRITPPTGIPLDDDSMVYKPSGFTDDYPGMYYHDALLWGKENSIANGYSDGSFGIGKKCSRKDFLIFLWRMMGRPISGNVSIVFNDVGSYIKASDTYQAIAWAASNGIAKGYNDGGFHPSEPVKRKDAMIMIYRAAQPDGRFEMEFTDVSVKYLPTSDTYKAIAWGAASGITNGYNNTSEFYPLAECSREQAITFLYRWSMN